MKSFQIFYKNLILEKIGIMVEMKAHSKPKVVIICLSFHLASGGIYVLHFRLLQSKTLFILHFV